MQPGCKVNHQQFFRKKLFLSNKMYIFAKRKGNYMGEKMIHRIEDIEQMALETGFLPFFYCGIDGLSIEEHTPRELWFSDEQDGPWEWKGPLIGMGSLAYGKLYNGKAGFVSLEWLPDLLNYRRSCYRFPYNDAEREVFDTVVSHQTMLTKDIKRECGFVRPRAPKLSPMEREALRDTPRSLWPKGGEARNRGFETIITRLQMSLRFVVADFEYNYDREGKRYGWGVARYTTPELMYGEEMFITDRSPEESLQRIITHLNKKLPYAAEWQIEKIIIG